MVRTPSHLSLLLRPHRQRARISSSEDVLRSPEAPNGTVELLIDAAMRALHEAGSRFVTLGLAPLAGAIGGFIGTRLAMAGRADVCAWARGAGPN